MTTKKIQLQENSVGGIDLLVERDAGNEVLILTGSKKYSIDFWKTLQILCEQALSIIKNKE